jgi:hypothetical protein
MHRARMRYHGDVPGNPYGPHQLWLYVKLNSLLFLFNMLVGVLRVVDFAFYIVVGIAILMLF